MATITLSPNGSPVALPPSSGAAVLPPTTSSQSNQTTNSPPPSVPPPSTTVPVTPPPSPSLSPPPPSTTPPPTSPPPALSPPPIVTSPPPASSAPSVVTSPPPTPSTTAPPPAETSPSIPNLSPPPRSAGSPPPQSSKPPPSESVLPSPPPPPANVPKPPSTKPPSPAPPAKPPKSNTPSPPSHDAPPPSVSHTPPSPSTDVPPPSTSTVVPPPSTLPSTPPSVPSESAPPRAVSSGSAAPPAASLPRPPRNETVAAGGPTVSLPSIPTEKPTARPTVDGSGNAATINTPSHSGGLNTGGAVAIGVVVSLVVLSLLVMAVLFVRKKKKGKGPITDYAAPSPFTSSHNSGTLFLKPQSPANFIGSGNGSEFVYSPSEPGGVNSSRSWFTYEELIQATNGFSEHNMLGEGGFGCVYKGLLIDGREVAVKQLKIGGGQGEREFRAEVETISRVHHRHLVSLVGYCISEHQRLLVYDYVPNNTLHYHLHDENAPVLNWPIRVKVAAGAARGIAYLHEDCHPRIIHRDIKSSNILLDQNFEALVSDFGLAKLTLDSNTHITTRVMGTFGYMAPEYATSGKLTDKSDVYSFGVVLLELITGRKPVDASQPIGDESLVEWARPLLIEALNSEDFETLADPRLGKNYNRNEMFRLIEAAAACVRHSSVKRPKMSQVVRAFDSMDEFSDLNNGMKPGQSSVFDSAQQSAQIRMFRRMAFGSQDSSASSFFNESQSSYRTRDQDSTSIFPQNKSRSWNFRDDA